MPEGAVFIESFACCDGIEQSRPPARVIKNWRMFKVGNAELVNESTVHVVGDDSATAEGYVSAPLDVASIEWNDFYVEAESKNGGIVLLIGPPDLFEKARYVWQKFVYVNRLEHCVGAFEDITDSIPPGLDFFQKHWIEVGAVCPPGVHYLCNQCENSILPGERFSTIVDRGTESAQRYCWFCRSFDNL